MTSQQLIQSIGWTLIHSLWQGLVIFVILKVAVRFTQRADVRYGLGVASMVLMVISAAATFFVLNKTTPSQSLDIILTKIQAASVEQSSVMDWINSNIIWFIRFWMIGLAIGLFRIAAGLWYINRLRRNSHPVHAEWMDLVKSLSESLNINRVVMMAEARISSPMVVGFMKPIILFPVGLLSGLSTEQVETILVHELSHIRRQDYIINLVQSVIETIFFFNPFVLLISSLIREERENCCDDMVIAKGVSPISYVRTLAQLEAARSSSNLAMAFAGNQNQLLNRIKRIMENSAKNDWGKGRLIPVALLFLGLVCASWLSISTEKEMQVQPGEKSAAKHKVLAQDTSREDGLVVIKRGSGYNGWVVEDVPTIGPKEDFEWTGEFAPVPEFPGIDPMEFDMNFEMPPMPLIPDFDELSSIPFGFDEFIQWDSDSIREFQFYGPDSIPAYEFRLREPVDWEQFEKEFTEKFQSKYKEFYEKNKEQIKKMMKDSKRDESRHREAAETLDLAEMQRMSEMHFAMSADMAREARRAQEMNIEAMREAQGHQIDAMINQGQQQNLMIQDMARKTEAYQEDLTKLLAEDGYIKKGDALDGIHIKDMNGELIINGKKIKEKDRLKYRALRDSYFSGPMHHSGRNE